MRRKLSVIVIAIISAGLMACGASNSDLAEKPESNETLSEAESLSDDSVQDTGAEEENNKKEEEIADTETDTHNDIVPTWYLNSEGIGNKELGVFIRKNNDQLTDLYLTKGIEAPAPNSSDSTSQSIAFTCQYYEGDLEAYISDPHNSFDEETAKRGKIHNIDYIYAPWGESGVSIAFVGNGIAISTTTWLENEDIDDYISNLIKLIEPDDVSNIDCLAYLADDGLHCPALGIKIICNKNHHEIDVCVSNVRCDFTDFSSITIKNIAPVVNAQEAIDTYVTFFSTMSNETLEYSVIEGIAEINLGKCKYFGRGVTVQFKKSNSDTRYMWEFDSDDVAWSISIDYYENGSSYEDYIQVIEPLE